MGLQSHSTTILPQDDKVKVVISEYGDTLVQMSYESAKILLEDVLHYQYADSLLSTYKERDSLNTETITLQKEVLMNMGKEKENLQQIIDNYDGIIANKEDEMLLKDDIIKQQKKEIRKQKFLKVVGFSAAVILPILTLLAIA